MTQDPQNNNLAASNNVRWSDQPPAPSRRVHALVNPGDYPTYVNPEWEQFRSNNDNPDSFNQWRRERREELISYGRTFQEGGDVNPGDVAASVAANILGHVVRHAATDNGIDNYRRMGRPDEGSSYDHRGEPVRPRY